MKHSAANFQNIMKLRYIILFTFIAIIITACNFTLAEDVTPPPGYVSPTPAPTLVLVPQQTPNIADGAMIYAEKCAACHGDSGLGDGAQGLQLPVPVKAFGLPDIARPASPAQYFTTVTRGNMDRYMPPFSSLNDQQRWDVIAYVLTLHTTPEQVAQGKELFDSNCAKCSTDFFKDQTQMSALSDVELARIIRNGNDQVPAFGKNFSDDDLWAAAAYLRSLSFDTSNLAQGPSASATQAVVAGTPAPDASASTSQVFALGYGTVQGTIDNKTGSALPSDLVVTLHGFDHATGANAGATEVYTQEVKLNPDNTFKVNDVELPEGRIFLAEASYSGITMKSDIGVVNSGDTSISLPTITLYNVTKDTSTLVVDELHIFVQSDGSGTYQIIALYNFRNPGTSVVAVNLSPNQQEIPFLKYPTNAQQLGYEAVQDSAPLISLDNGFAMPPSDQSYGIMAFSSVSESAKSITQEIALSTNTVRIFVPDGVSLKGDKLTQESPQDIQGKTYQSYVANHVNAGDSLTFEVSGSPKATATDSTSSALSSHTLLIGIGILGLVLVLAGAFMYMRERKGSPAADDEEDGDEEEAEFSSADDVMDAIIALDDLHREKKISEDTYQKRRTELKEILKGMM